MVISCYSAKIKAKLIKYILYVYILRAVSNSFSFTSLAQCLKCSRQSIHIVPSFSKAKQCPKQIEHLGQQIR